MNGWSASKSELWVITTYFNFAGYERRLTNYRLFRKHIGAPLLTVELAAEGGFVLDEGDADILVRCSDSDVLWQKERLLNHGLSHLPPQCRYVAWVDGDVLFEHPDWVDRAIGELEHTHLLQPFSRVIHAPQDAKVRGFEIQAGWFDQEAVAGALKQRGSCEGRKRHARHHCSMRA